MTARGVDGTPIVIDDFDCRRFLRLLADVAHRFAWHCHAFCLMTNHYHVVLETSCSRLSAGFHRLNGLYAQAFNRRHGRRGHLFGDRFWSSAIEGEDHLLNACRYVVLNPVRSGLCERAEHWLWSASRYGCEV